MPLLLLFVVLLIAAGILFWRVSTQTSYRVKNRDRQRNNTARPPSERPGPNLSDMLD